MIYGLTTRLYDFPDSIAKAIQLRQSLIGGITLFLKPKDHKIYEGIINCGYQIENCLYLPYVLTDLEIAPHSIKTEDFLKTINWTEKEIKHSSLTNYHTPNGIYGIENHEGYVTRVFYPKDPFYHIDHYTDRLTHRKIYHLGHCIDTQYFNKDGSLAYSGYDEKKLMQKAFASLNFSDKDLLFIDWCLEYEDMIFENAGQAKIIDMTYGVHGWDIETAPEAYFTHTEKQLISPEEHQRKMTYWQKEGLVIQQKHCFYPKYLDHVTGIVSECSSQTQDIKQQFEQYFHKTVPVTTIPPRWVECRPNTSKPYKLVSVSGLFLIKHLEICIQAVVKAKQILPELTYDIHGEGTERDKLAQLIIDHNAQDYITLHKWTYDPMSVMTKYDTHITGTLSEGFCQSLLEANACGLKHIAFDVPYGVREHIKHQKNGILVDPNHKSVEQLIDDFAQAIVTLYQTDTSQYRQFSYDLASQYTYEHLVTQWQNLLAGLNMSIAP